MRGRVSSLLEVGTGFHPELTGRENVYLNGTILGMTKREIDRKFDEIVAFSGVEKFLDTPVKRYSSGMKVRLAFSVAAHLEPDILIVDEVLAVGDADFQRKCIGKMRDVAGSGGRTILLVSHNMASIASLAGQSVYLRDGQAVACGPTEEVIDLYMQQVHRPVGDGKPGLFVPRPETGSKSLVKSLEVYSRGRRTDTMRMGDDLKFLVTLDGQARPDVLSGVVGIAIDTTTGVRVLSLGSGQSGFRFENNGGDIRVTCDTGSCPLNQGQYLIRLVLAVKPGMPLENREALGHLHVLPSDVFGDGQLLTEHQGFIFWKADWNQQATDSDFASVDHGVSNIVGEDSL
jgi:lipopolysaccharide transport system ATP-binding protein